MGKLNRIFIGIPKRYHDGPLEPSAQKCLDGIQNYGVDKGLYESMEVQWGGMSISQNSYKLIRTFLFDEEGKKCSHFLYTGDDLTFPPDALAMLLEADRPVIVGCATWKTPPFFVNCSVLDSQGKESKIYVTQDMLIKGLVSEVFAAGSGFMLIKREVLEDVHNFWKEYYKNFTALMPKKFQNFQPVPYFPVTYDGEGFTSTDYAFCDAVRACGHKLFLHCGVVVGHIWKKQFSVLDHVQWRNNYGMATQEPDFPTQKIDPIRFKSSSADGKEYFFGTDKSGANGSDSSPVVEPALESVS